MTGHLYQSIAHGTTQHLISLELKDGKPFQFDERTLCGIKASGGGPFYKTTDRCGRCIELKKRQEQIDAVVTRLTK